MHHETFRIISEYDFAATSIRKSRKKKIFFCFIFFSRRTTREGLTQKYSYFSVPFLTKVLMELLMHRPFLRGSIATFLFANFLAADDLINSFLTKTKAPMKKRYPFPLDFSRFSFSRLLGCTANTETPCTRQSTCNIHELIIRNFCETPRTNRFDHLRVERNETQNFEKVSKFLEIKMSPTNSRDRGASYSA